MTEIEQLHKEIHELRSDLKSVVSLVRTHAKQRMLIEEYLCQTTSRTGWTQAQKFLAALVPFWGFFHPLRFLSAQPFELWKDGKLEALTARLNREAEMTERE
ncbi:hypothetical protein [Blastomonas sp.]|uniref:hypothetical protein n=1 Tax=Blastomonas sp. TaxID=1909299 RepID=UPI0035934919